MEAQESNKTEQTTDPDTEPKIKNNKEKNGKREDYYHVIDIDLTVLSSTMVFSEVYEIMVNPEACFGKVMKMKGFCARYYDNVTGNDYFACMIPDATACCQTGIEFVLADDYVFPDNYPEKDAEICIVEVFDVFQESDYRYCALRNARLVY